MQNPWVIGLLSWVVPGGGHFLAGRWERGLIIGAVIWAMFIIGVLSGGAYYPGYDFKDGFLLYLLNVFARMGNILGYVISLVIASTPAPNVASWATFEYGGRFLEVAGLLNYLASIDAFDIAAGRKE